MTHPCEGHSCDHCYLCDVVGVCCQTVAPGQQVPLNVLHAAILADAGRIPSFAELVRSEAQRHRPKLPVPSPSLPPPAPTTPISCDQQKEAIHVAVPRPIQ